MENKYAIWSLSSTCNFNCVYCTNYKHRKEYLKPSQKIKQYFEFLIRHFREPNWILYKTKKELFNKRMCLSEESIQKAVDAFERTGPWLINFSGEGEPFCFDGFVDLAEKLAKNHFISIDTNLSLDVDDFISRIAPNKVKYVHCSVHILEREKRNLKEDFLRKVKLLKDCGYETCVSYVIYPPLLSRFEEDFAYFKKEGIVLKPKLFRGGYEEKRYPNDYTREEWEFIERYLKEANWKLSGRYTVKNKRIFLKDDYRGSLCDAGKDSITICSDGSVLRCVDDRKYLGNIFKGEMNLLKNIEKCGAKKCSCPPQRLRIPEI